MVALAPGQAEEAFFENGITAVPQREGDVEELVPIADAAHAVVAPAVDLRPRLIVGQRVPGCARGAVIFPRRAPGTCAEIGAPALPMGGPLAGCVESAFFVGHRCSSACRGDSRGRAIA
jgi:hypothetical protein